MKIKFTLLLLVVFVITSCNSHKEVDNKMKELIKLEQAETDKDGNILTDNSLTSLESEEGSNISGNTADGSTKMKVYENTEDKIKIKVDNLTGNVLSGYTQWDDLYELEYKDMFIINDEGRIGFGGTISKSARGTKDISYNIKYIEGEKQLYISIFGGTEKAPWKQWCYFKFKNPETVVSILKSIQSEID